VLHTSSAKNAGARYPNREDTLSLMVEKTQTSVLNFHNACFSNTFEAEPFRDAVVYLRGLPAKGPSRE